MGVSTTVHRTNICVCKCVVMIDFGKLIRNNYVCFVWGKYVNISEDAIHSFKYFPL